MRYVLQQGLFRGYHEERLIKTLVRFKLPVYFFKHIPFTEDLRNQKLDQLVV
jgi:hypothetical protein